MVWAMHGLGNAWSASDGEFGLKHRMH